MENHLEKGNKEYASNTAKQHRQRKGKLGFTLVELLAVIVILAIILVIAVPNIMGIIKDTRNKAYEAQVKMVTDAAKKYVIGENIAIPEGNGVDITLGNLSSKKYMDDKVIDPRCNEDFYTTTKVNVKMEDSRLVYTPLVKSPCTENGGVDQSEPEFTSSIRKTYNTITLQVNTVDDIVEYAYRIDNNNPVKSSEASHTFTSLNPKTKYTVCVEVTKENLKKKEACREVTTEGFASPTITVKNPTVLEIEKEVVITYPSMDLKNQYNLVYSYRIGGSGAFTTVDTDTKTIKVNTNNTDVIAKVVYQNTEETKSIRVTNVDDTAPDFTINAIGDTSSSIKVDLTNVSPNIKTYEYKVEGRNYVSVTSAPPYTITGLKADTEYTVVVKLTKTNNKSTEKKMSTKIKTKEVSDPTITPTTSGWAQSRVVNITYPDKGNNTNLRYEYKKTEDSRWKTVNTNSIQVTLTQNTSLIARIVDTSNTSSPNNKEKSYTESRIDNVTPSITATLTNPSTSSLLLTITQSNTNPSGVSYAYSINNQNAWVDLGTSTVKTITNLEPNTSYTIYVKATSSTGLTSSYTIPSKCTEELGPHTGTANAPKLVTNLIPVRYNGSEWVVADKNNSSNTWYNYDSKEWANAVTVIDSARTKYSTTGTVVNEDDVVAYYVWIPRYKYKIFNPNLANTVSPQQIEVVFELASATKSDGGVNPENGTASECGKYYTHPAFTYDNRELTGFWVNKFEMTGSATTPTSKPMNSPLNSLNVSGLFSATQAMATNGGLSSNDHTMIKNMEWGAVVYLALSKYGQGNPNTNPVYKNSYYGNDYKTGMCGSSWNAIREKNTTPYNEINGMKCSTSGNITGIYDMNGGLYEYTMGVMASSTTSTTPLWQDSGLSSLDPKYYDLYKYGTSTTEYARAKYGDASSEIRGWTGVAPYSLLPYKNVSWVRRGGGTLTGDSGLGSARSSSGYDHASYYTGSAWVSAGQSSRAVLRPS